MEVYNNSLCNANDPTLSENPFENIRLPGKIKDSKYEVVSTAAYLIGVPKYFFEHENEPPKLEKYNQLEYDKNARIVRHLCIIRTSIERNFKNINDAMFREYRSLLSMPEYIPADSLKALSNDGIQFIKKSSTKLTHHIIELNRLISDRINNCRSLFPDWLKWEYIKDLFIMPNGLTEAGTKAASDLYYSYKSYYPYKQYINWSPYDVGNLLYDDRKFVTILYEQHNDYFDDFSKTSDVGDRIKNSIYDFLGRSRHTVIFVDCENSDPYKLYAALQSLDEQELSTISKIILFDDVHTTVAWRILENFTNIPIEHMMIERLLSNKSLVDAYLISRANKEFYQNGLDSMILCTSDSDYWALIDTLPFANFLVMVERDACAQNLKEALSNSNIFYCYLDDFYTGGQEELKFTALRSEISRQLKSYTFNIHEILNQALRTTRAEMSPTEQKRFIEKYLLRLTLDIDGEGDVSFDLNLK